MSSSGAKTEKPDRPPRPDNSEERLSPSAAHESHEWYRLIVDNVTDFAIFSTDTNGVVSSWNPGAERFFGYKAEEILGKPIELLYVPEDQAAGVPKSERTNALEKGSCEDERWHLRKDGTRFFVFGRVNPMFTDAGEHRGFIKIARDITVRKELQTRLDSAEHLHRLILDNLQDFAIFTIDGSSKIETWNRGAEQTFGYTRQEITGKSLAILYPPEARAQGEPEKALAAAVANSHLVEEHWCVRKDGGRIFMTEVLRPIYDATGNLRAFSKVGRDITARHNMQQDLEQARAGLERIVAHRTASLTDAVRELEMFSYSLSHDMRAPLRAMQGFAEILLKEYAKDVPPDARELLQRISAASQRLDLMLRESLSFYGRPREPLPLEPVDLQPILQTVTSEHPELLGPGRLRVHPPLHRVMAHAASLTQVLANLLSNAARFVDGQREPHIDVRTEPSAQGCVRLWVEDNGIGIAAGDREKIWNLFSRLHPERFVGSGIGLALVRQSVERMGGRVGVESIEGQGSRFWIELKAVQP